MARTHLKVAESQIALPRAMNVGTGKGSSVRKIIGLLSIAIGRTDVKPNEKDRRSGDFAILCADVSLIQSTIGFSFKFSLEMSVESLVQSPRETGVRFDLWSWHWMQW